MSITATITDSRIVASFSGSVNVDVDTAALATSTGAASIGTADGGTVQDALSALPRKTLVLWTGNSLVDGIGLTPAPSKLQTALGDGFTVINLGRSGETAAQIRSRFDAYADVGYTGFYVISGPDAVNSVRLGENAASIEADLAAIYAAAKATRPDCTVIAITDTPWKGYAGILPGNTDAWTTGHQAITDAVNVWKATAANVDIVVDAYADFEDPANPDTLKAIYDDGLHLHYPQAGQDRLAALVEAAVTFAADPNVKLVVSGNTAAIDQDVTALGTPLFDKLTVGSQQYAFDGNLPLIDAQHTGDSAGRGVGIGTKARTDPSVRELSLDQTWRLFWRTQIAGVAGDKGMGIYCPSRFYGSGVAAMVFSTAADGDVHERMIILPTGEVGIGMGGVDPSRPFVVSNGGVECMEFGFISGAALQLNINRSSGAYIDANYWAARHIFTHEGTAQLVMDSAEAAFYLNVVPSGTVDSGSSGARWNKVWGVDADFSGVIKTAPSTVAALPSAATAGVGARAFVSDATVTTFASTVVGGGTNFVPVYSDGTDWKIG